MNKDNKRNKGESQESVLGVAMISVGCVVISIGFILFYRLNIALSWAIIGYVLSSLIISSHNKKGITFYKLIKLANAIVGIFSLCLVGYGLIMNEPTQNKKQLSLGSTVHIQRAFLYKKSVCYQNLSNICQWHTV